MIAHQMFFYYKKLKYPYFQAALKKYWIVLKTVKNPIDLKVMKRVMDRLATTAMTPAN